MEHMLLHKWRLVLVKTLCVIHMIIPFKKRFCCHTWKNLKCHITENKKGCFTHKYFEFSSWVAVLFCTVRVGCVPACQQYGISESENTFIHRLFCRKKRRVLSLQLYLIWNKCHICIRIENCLTTCKQMGQGHSATRRGRKMQEPSPNQVAAHIHPSWNM